jgi:hypothetical protein
VTPENQETNGPAEQLHFTYIDPFYLDRRNFDPTRASFSPSSSEQVQTRDVESPLPEPFVSKLLFQHLPPELVPSEGLTLSPENHDHSFELPESSTQVLTQVVQTQALSTLQQFHEKEFGCNYCSKSFEQPFQLKYV